MERTRVEAQGAGTLSRRPWRPWRITPARVVLPRPTLRSALREVAWILVVTAAYFLTRGLIRGRYGDAVQHARALLALEGTLHLDPEMALQRLAVAHTWLMDAANALYLAGHLPVLIAVAVWLYWWHPWAYRWFRWAFLLSALLGLCVYVVLPMAPPRFLPGFVDTLKVSGLNVDGSAVGLLYNPYAAMPSLHVGWALLAGIAVLTAARAWWLRLAAGALPLCMLLAVLMTGNHYLLDTVAGAVVAMFSLSVSAWWCSRMPPDVAATSADAPGVVDAESEREETTVIVIRTGPAHRDAQA